MDSVLNIPLSCSFIFIQTIYVLYAHHWHCIRICWVEWAVCAKPQNTIDFMASVLHFLFFKSSFASWNCQHSSRIKNKQMNENQYQF